MAFTQKSHEYCCIKHDSGNRNTVDAASKPGEDVKLVSVGNIDKGIQSSILEYTADGDDFPKAIIAISSCLSWSQPGRTDAPLVTDLDREPVYGANARCLSLGANEPRLLPLQGRGENFDETWAEASCEVQGTKEFLNSTRTAEGIPLRYKRAPFEAGTSQPTVCWGWNTPSIWDSLWVGPGLMEVTDVDNHDGDAPKCLRQRWAAAEHTWLVRKKVTRRMMGNFTVQTPPK